MGILAKINAFAKQKRGQFGLQNLSAAAVGVLVFIIVLSVAATVLAQIQGTQTNQSTAYNVTGTGLTGLGTMSAFTSVIVVIAVAAVIIGLIAIAFRAFA